MEKAKKVKIFLGSAYILILVTFLWFIFSHFSISDFSSFDIIKENRNNLNKVKNNNFFLSSFLFLILFKLSLFSLMISKLEKSLKEK